MESTERNRIGYVAFDETLEFLIVEATEDGYTLPTADGGPKYHEVIYAIKGFMDILGKKMDCWEPLVEYDGVSYYCIMADFDDIDVESSEKYDYLSINDINNVECDPKLKWIAYMALDKSFRKKKISD